MGGDGSGRKPSVETLIKQSQPNVVPVGDGMFIPNYSGIQEAALKTEAPLSAGGGGSSEVPGSNGSVQLAYVTGGEVSEVVLNNPGSGYLAEDFLVLNAGNENCYIIVDTVGGSGEILTFHLDDGGVGSIGYILENGVGVYLD